MALSYEWINIDCIDLFWIGPRIAWVDILIEKDPDTCTLNFKGWMPGRGSAQFMANGIRFQYSVIPLSTKVAECPDQPGACKKTLEVQVIVRSTGVIGGMELFPWTTNYSVILETTCLPQCCG